VSEVQKHEGQATPDSREAAAAYLLAHPNWRRLGPKRQEIAMLLALNEFEPVSNELSGLSNTDLETKYRYSRVQFKNTFAALRALGIARPHERYEVNVPVSPLERGRGRRQIATSYTLEAHATGGAWKCSPRKSKTPYRPGLGRVPFTPEEDLQAARELRSRQEIGRAQIAKTGSCLSTEETLGKRLESAYPLSLSTLSSSSSKGSTTLHSRRTDLQLGEVDAALALRRRALEVVATPLGHALALAMLGTVSVPMPEEPDEEDFEDFEVLDPGLGAYEVPA
jgi:hypothetical protein